MIVHQRSGVGSRNESGGVKQRKTTPSAEIKTTVLEPAAASKNKGGAGRTCRI